jgi:hypothetical protein
MPILVYVRVIRVPRLLLLPCSLPEQESTNITPAIKGN